MRILLCPHYWAPGVGGVEIITLALARGLACWHERHGGEALDVIVATPTPADGMDDSRLPFRVVRQPGARELARLIRSADAIHVAGPCLLPLLIGKLLRKPMLVEHHGYQAGCPNGLLFYEPTKTACPGHFMARRYEECVRCNVSNQGTLRSIRLLLLTFVRRWLSQSARCNVHITRHVAARLQLANSSVIYYGIPDLLASGIQHERAAGGDLPFVFAYVGRLVSEKGLPVLLRAAAKLQGRGYNFHLKFIGDGPERHQLENESSELKLRGLVSFCGSLRGEALDAALSDVAAVVMPSVWEETAGLAAIEQMMRGRVVIVSDLGGLPEVAGKAGLKFTPGDAEALFACLRRAIEEPVLRTRLGERARQRALQLFREERMVEEHLAAYRAMAAGSTG